MNTDIRILQTLDREQAHYTSAILVARNEAESELYRSCLSVIQRILATVREVDKTESDETNYTVEQVIDRLQRKVNARRSVAQDSVASDNIRLACRSLRRLIQPAQADNEPIDIFIV